MLFRVRQNFVEKINKCLDENGQQFEHLLNLKKIYRDFYLIFDFIIRLNALYSIKV